MAEKKTEPKAAPARGYVVLVQTSTGQWKRMDVFDGNTPKQAIQNAIKASTDEQSGKVTYAAIPARSWHEMRREVTTVQKELWT